jgi:hypothetical protein
VRGDAVVEQSLDWCTKSTYQREGIYIFDSLAVGDPISPLPCNAYRIMARVRFVPMAGRDTEIQQCLCCM